MQYFIPYKILDSARSCTSYFTNVSFSNYLCNISIELIIQLYLYVYREKVDWATQFRLLLFRSITCFIRNYKEKLLEFCILMVRYKDTFSAILTLV